MSDKHKQATVYIIDDDEAVRDALEMLVKSIGLPSLSYESAIAFLDQYSDDLIGCLVLDIRMPLMSGLELQDELIARGSSLPIIFISGHGDIQMAVKAVKKGAMDFISKPFRDQELLDCIHSALHENHEVQEELSQQRDIAARMAILSPREKQVLDLMVEGLANKVIASNLDISQRTVEVHRAKVMQKMKVKSLTHLVKTIAILPA